MSDFVSIEQVLDYAIAREVDAYQLYKKLAGAVKKPKMREVLKGFAEEELEHKIRLEAVKAGEVAIEDEEVGSLGISDKTGPVKPHVNMSYPEILAFAMNKEKTAFTLYINLASIAKTKQLRQTFAKLAQEEAQHKLRFEIEYDWETF